MIFLIGQLAFWLMLTAAFAALAGWSFAALRAEPAEAAARRERGRLVADLVAISGDLAPEAVGPEFERERDLLRRRADLDAARVAELDRALEAARAHADDAVARIAELERSAEREHGEPQEVAQLREELTLLRADQARAIEVKAEPIADNGAALQAWRLRYFEQRVRYLEGNEAEAARVALREAEARVAHPEDELRVAAAAPAEAPADGPFAASAETDMLLRWRMLYLEKRVAHLQAEAHAAAPEALNQAMDAEEAEKWKWRTRYLEARTRHLESLLAAAPAQSAMAAVAAPPTGIEFEPAAPAPLVPAGAEERPPALPGARGGLPDDFTLIEGVSAIQQTTLNALGIYHFDQIAAWTPANIAWIDQYLRLRGRIVEEEWTEQAEDMAREGVQAARRASVEEDA
jgi:predicted flap endonuclease-1-like 5' DNA nuclease